MPPRSESMKRLVELASRTDLKPFEDAWIDQIATDPSDIDGLLDAISRLESQGQFDKAGQYLQLLLETYKEAGDDDKTLRILKKLAAVAPRQRGIRHGLIEVYKRKYADREDVEQLMELAGMSTGADLLDAIDRIESYLSFTPGSYVEHPAGWGVGIVREVDIESAEVTIDFAEMKGHQISLEMAHNITQHLSRDHFKAMKFDRLDELKEMADKDPVGLVKKVVLSRVRKSTGRDIRQRLTDGVIPVKDWSRWWTRARAKVKRDPNIKIGTGNNPTIEVTAEEQSFEDQTLNALRSLKDLSAKVKFVRGLFAELHAHPETQSAIVNAAGVLAKAAADQIEKAPGAVLSLALTLENVREVESGYEIPAELVTENLLTDPWKTLEMLQTVPVTADRRVILKRLRGRFPDDWQDVYEKALYIGENDIGDYCLKELIAVGAFDRLTRVVFELLDRFREHRRAFLWYVKAATSGKLHEALPHPGPGSLLEKLLILHSHTESRYIQTGREDLRAEFRGIDRFLQARNYDVVKKTIKAIDTHRARDLYNITRSSRSLPDDVKDGMIAAMLRSNPEIAKAAAEEEGDEVVVDERVIWVTREGFQKYQEAFQQLVDDEIPRNAKEIGRAASYGDLSENAEWTAALDKQSMLSRKAEEMREQIEKARIIDESLISSDEVNVGCKVAVRNGATGAHETYTLLGPWDVDTERGIISYLSPLGRALLGKKVGQAAEIDLPDGRVTMEVLGIESGLAATSDSE